MRTQAINGQAQPQLYFKVRVYNTGNTTHSDWAKTNTTKVSLIAKVYVRIPDEQKLKNVYFYTPDSTKKPKVSFKI